eukprot:sb/3469791/
MYVDYVGQAIKKVYFFYRKTWSCSGARNRLEFMCIMKVSQSSFLTSKCSFLTSKCSFQTFQHYFKQINLRVFEVFEVFEVNFKNFKNSKSRVENFRLQKLQPAPPHYILTKNVHFGHFLQFESIFINGIVFSRFQPEFAFRQIKTQKAHPLGAPQVPGFLKTHPAKPGGSFRHFHINKTVAMATELVTMGTGMSSLSLRYRLTNGHFDVHLQLIIEIIKP